MPIKVRLNSINIFNLLTYLPLFLSLSSIVNKKLGYTQQPPTKLGWLVLWTKVRVQVTDPFS